MVQTTDRAKHVRARGIHTRPWCAGGGCAAKVPAPLPTCPNATVGPRNTSWEPGGDVGCCTWHTLHIGATRRLTAEMILDLAEHFYSGVAHRVNLFY
jgi:hypothetical protein